MAPDISPVLAIGLDAFESELLARWTASGDLPNLADLLDRGRFLRLDSEWPGIPLEPWHSFVSDEALGCHGNFYLKVWVPEEGRVRLGPRWRAASHPFWRPLVEAGQRVATVDVPFAPAPADNPAEIAVAGWQSHDEVEAGCRPAELGRDLRARLGPPALGAERYGDVSARRLVDVRDRCLAATRQFREIVLGVLERGPFDLVLAVLGAAHRGGHYLWDPARLADDGRLEPDMAEALDGALLEVYRAADAALGTILAAVPPSTRVLVFALHGMGPAQPWTERLPLILDFLAHPGKGAGGASTRGWLARARRSPLALAAARILPAGIQNGIARLVSRRLYDWSRTRVFAVPSEGVGAIRVNLAGRERFGIVRPGADYRAVLEGVAEGLLGLREVESGEPLVETLLAVDDVVDADAPARRLLPDLVVRWRELPPACGRRVATPDGRVRDFGAQLCNTSGRTGEHRPAGFAILTGPGIAAGRDPVTRSVRDLPALLRALALGSPEAPGSLPAIADQV